MGSGGAALWGGPHITFSVILPQLKSSQSLPGASCAECPLSAVYTLTGVHVKPPA